MPSKEAKIKGKLYINGRELIQISEMPEFSDIEMCEKPIGDLHSVPHYRCGVCYKAVVVFCDDEKPDRCKWCGTLIDWRK